MTASALGNAGWSTDTRRRLLDVALTLFIRHSFAGTSLQMIADELGFTKAAIYYHFRTREQLMIAVMEPILDQIRPVIEAAERQGTARARAGSMVSGYADVVARNRSVAAVLTSDPSVRGVLRDQPEWSDAIERQMALLAELEPGPAGTIKATAVLTGLAGAASDASVNIDDDTLRQQLFDVGRRVLGLRTPARRRATIAPDARSRPSAPLS
jgi:AcrR family transcriptional regulator